MPGQVDPYSGAFMQVVAHDMDTFIGDVLYFTLAVYVSDMVGWSELIIPASSRMESAMWQSIRNGVLLSSYVEFRKWMEHFGIDTNLIHWIPSIN